MSLKEESDKTLSVLDKLDHRKPIRQHVKEFACIFAIIALGFSGYSIWHESGPLPILTGIGIALVLLVLGYRAPIVLYPLWKGWMALALALGFIVTNIVLLVMWICVFFPLAMILKIVGKKVMDTSFDRSIESYWNERDEKFHDFKLLERQF